MRTSRILSRLGIDRIDLLHDLGLIRCLLESDLIEMGGLDPLIDFCGESRRDEYDQSPTLERVHCPPHHQTEVILHPECGTKWLDSLFVFGTEVCSEVYTEEDIIVIPNDLGRTRKATASHFRAPFCFISQVSPVHVRTLHHSSSLVKPSCLIAKVCETCQKGGIGIRKTQPLSRMRDT